MKKMLCLFVIVMIGFCGYTQVVISSITKTKIVSIGGFNSYDVTVNWGYSGNSGCSIYYNWSVSSIALGGFGSTATSTTFNLLPGSINIFSIYATSLSDVCSCDSSISITFIDIPMTRDNDGKEECVRPDELPYFALSNFDEDSIKIEWVSFLNIVIKYRALGDTSWNKVWANGESYVLQVEEATTYELRFAQNCSGTVGRYSGIYTISTPE